MTSGYRILDLRVMSASWQVDKSARTHEGGRAVLPHRQRQLKPGSIPKRHVQTPLSTPPIGQNRTQLSA